MTTFAGVAALGSGPDGRPLAGSILADVVRLPAAGGTSIVPGPDVTNLGPIIVPATLFVLLIVAVFAAFGFVQGFRRQLVTLVLVLGAYWLVTTRWPLLADRLEPFVPEQATGLAEVGAFAFLVLLAYGLSTRLARVPKTSGLQMLKDVHSLLERVMGAVLGGAIGYLAARFTLPRLMGSSPTEVVLPGPEAQTLLEGQGGNMFWLIVAVLILFGVMSLTPRKKAG